MADLKVKNQKVNWKDFLGIKQVIPEMKSLPKKFLYFMIVACVIILFFNFFDVQGAEHGSYFLPYSTYIDAKKGSVFGSSNGAAITVAVLYSLNGLASFTGIIAVSMIAFDKSTQYFWGVINAVFFGLFAISVGYLGDLIMQVIIILCCPLGWYLFEKAMMNPNHDKKRGWKFNVFFFVGVALAITLVTLVLYEFLPRAFEDTFGKLEGVKDPYWMYDGDHPIMIGDDHKINYPQRVLDSLGNGFNTVGYVLQLINFHEQMYIWFLNDIIKLLKFTNISDGTLSINMILQFVIWLSMDVIGIYQRLFKDYIDGMIASIKSKRK